MSEQLGEKRWELSLSCEGYKNNVQLREGARLSVMSDDAPEPELSTNSMSLTKITVNGRQQQEVKDMKGAGLPSRCELNEKFKSDQESLRSAIEV